MSATVREKRPAHTQGRHGRRPANDADHPSFATSRRNKPLTTDARQPTGIKATAQVHEKDPDPGADESAATEGVAGVSGASGGEDYRQLDETGTPTPSEKVSRWHRDIFLVSPNQSGPGGPPQVHPRQCICEQCMAEYGTFKFYNQMLGGSGKPPGGGKESRDREVETAELSGAARAVAANSDGDAVLELDVTELKKAASRASKKRPQEALRKTSLAVR